MMNQEDRIKVSVVIPVYNVANYIRQCIKSVQNQSWNNIEIILVDDGSTDDSPQICDELCGEDDRIIVIHQENQGAAEARNVGIKAATGEYLLFLDCDDFWNEAQAVERIVNRIVDTQADVLNFSYQKYYEDTEEIVPYYRNISSMPDTCDTAEKQRDYLTKKNLYIASACNKLIRRDLFDEGLLFPTGNYSEDIEWSARLFIKAGKMDFVCENFYCYRQRHGSTTHSITQKKCEDLCYNIIRCIELAEELSEPMKTYLYRYAAYQYGTFFLVQAQAENEPKECLEELAKYKWILRFHERNKKLIVLNACCGILGYVSTCKLVRKIGRR